MRSRHSVHHVLLLGLVLVLLLNSSYADEKMKMGGMGMEGDETGGKISFETPDLSDEETYSQHMPATLKCDGCRIIAMKLRDKLTSVQKKSTKRDLTESEIIELVEDVCEKKNAFENYGVKMVRGEKRLSGPGFETADEPGILQGGGKWPGRLHEMCVQYAGDIGEEEIYAKYRVGADLEQYLCHGSGLRGYCRTHKPGKPEGKSKQRKQEL